MKQALVNCQQYSNNGNALATIPVNRTFPSKSTQLLLPRQILKHASNNFVHYEMPHIVYKTSNTLHQPAECIR